MYKITDKDVPINQEVKTSDGKILRVLPAEGCESCFFGELTSCRKTEEAPNLVCSRLLRSDKKSIVFLEIKPNENTYKDKFFPIGSTFTHIDGTKLIVSKQEGCHNCYFDHFITCKGKPSCGKGTRSDNQSVIFKEL